MSTALVLIPVFVVSIRLALAPQVIMLEGCRSGLSIERSWAMTRGSMWRVVSLGVIVMLLTLVLNLLPVAAIIYGMTLLGVDQPTVSALQAGLHTSAEIIVTPFSLIPYTLLFFELRMRAEGLDLDQLLADHFMAGDYEPSPGA
jgi:membrane-anchored glycerophosphoryl diester phosphodiesterase (GDPDase)